MEGVFHEATVLIDERPIATNGNGWTEFEIDLTTFLNGVETLALGVDAHAPDDRFSERRGFSQTLAGKQDWYGLQGGIWKAARLEARKALHLKTIAVQTSTDLESHHVKVRGELSIAAPASLRIALVRVGTIVSQQEYPVSASTFDLSLPIADVDLWSPDEPNLYQLIVSLVEGETIVDAIERTVGFRLFEARDAKLFLNGRPFSMFGALDQDWYPTDECRTPSAAFLEQRFRNAKAMGFNTLRCHVKIPDQHYLDLADRLGLVVWLDMPYVEFLAPAARENLTEVFRRSAATHGHHPSIAIWTLFNEGWASISTTIPMIGAG
jgi:beta-galactosidase/beta-glucuronidase